MTLYFQTLYCVSPKETTSSCDPGTMIKFRKFNIWVCSEADAKARLGLHRCKRGGQVELSDWMACLPAEGADVESGLSVSTVPCWVKMAWPVPCLSQWWAWAVQRTPRSPLGQLKPTLMKRTAWSYFLPRWGVVACGRCFCLSSIIQYCHLIYSLYSKLPVAR